MKIWGGCGLMALLTIIGGSPAPHLIQQLSVFEGHGILTRQHAFELIGVAQPNVCGDLYDIGGGVPRLVVLMAGFVYLRATELSLGASRIPDDGTLVGWLHAH